MKKITVIILIMFNCFQLTFSQEKQKNSLNISGNNNSINTLNQKNVYIGKQFKNFYSTTNIDKVINLTPLFNTIKNFISEIEKKSNFNTNGFKNELDRLNEEFIEISNSTNGNHIENLDAFLKDFLSLYVNVLNNKKINFNDQLGNAFVIFSDYKRNKNDFKINSIDGKFFLTNKKKRNYQNNDIIVYPYKEGMAKIKFKNKYGFIDIYGNLVIDIKYDKVRDFSNGYTVCYNGNFTYIIDKEGQFLKKESRLSVNEGNIRFYDYKNGWFRIEYGDFCEYYDNIFTNPNHLSYNYLNDNFQLLNNSNYIAATDFCNNFAYVKDTLGYHKINNKGEIIKNFNERIYEIINNSKCINITYEKEEVINSEESIYLGIPPIAYKTKIPYKQLMPITNNIVFYNADIISPNSYNMIDIETILADSIIPLKNNLIKYRIRKEPIRQIHYQYCNADYENTNAILRDNNDKILLGPFKKIENLLNDYFLYSSNKPIVLNYKLPDKINELLKKDSLKTHQITYYKSLGLINPNSEVIISENKDYNTLKSYNKSLYVFGKIQQYYDYAKVKTKEHKKTKDGLKYYRNKYITVEKKIDYKLLIVKYGLINNNGIEVLPLKYDDIKLLSNELVETRKNGIKQMFYIDELGNAKEVKNASR